MIINIQYYSGTYDSQILAVTLDKGDGYLLIHNLLFRHIESLNSKEKKPVVRDLSYVSAFLYVTHSITLVHYYCT